MTQCIQISSEVFFCFNPTPFPFFICPCVSDVMRECLIGILTAVSMLGPIFPYVNARLCGGTSANVQGLSLHRTGVTFIMPASNSFSLRSIQYQSFQTVKKKDPEKTKSKRKERNKEVAIVRSAGEPLHAFIKFSTGRQFVNGVATKRPVPRTCD